jgi:hypothetical protein
MTIICIAMFCFSLLACCSERKPAPTSEAAGPSTQAATTAPASGAGKTGVVLEAINTAGYTYVHVDTGTEKFWAAAPQFPVEVGDDVVVPEGMPMPSYHSKTLDRTFDMVYFVSSVAVGGAQSPTGDLPAGHPPIDSGKAAAETTDIDPSDITPAEGGQTVAEIFANHDDLAGQPVKIRGKVVKFAAAIMGKNWIHIQDGTGAAGSNDLTVTTLDTAAVGDTVTVSGVLATHRDFGAGYVYEVIVEDARVTVE